jgi:DNA-binding MarR family transcriptional regulator
MKGVPSMASPEAINYGVQIERTAKRIKQALQKRFNTANIDITVDQWVILDCLNKTDGVSQNKLADDTFKDAPTVTRILDLLTKKELIERKADDSDRRKYRIYLTTKGREMIDMMLPIVMDLRHQGGSRLSPSDFQHLIRILGTIFDNFGEDGLPDLE